MTREILTHCMFPALQENLPVIFPIYDVIIRTKGLTTLKGAKTHGPQVIPRRDRIATDFQDVWTVHQHKKSTLACRTFGILNRSA